MDIFIPQDVNNANYLVDLGNGNSLTLKPYNPHGFWRVTIAKGQLPEYLKGQYTTFDEAKRDVIKYMSEKK